MLAPMCYVLCSSDTLLQRLSMVSDSPKKNSVAAEEQDTSSDVSAASLIEIVDGIVYLYHIAAHKQLGKVGKGTCVNVGITLTPFS